MPTGLIVSGANASAYTNFAESLCQRIEKYTEASIIQLNPSQAPNLKSTLKHINQQAINRFSEEATGTQYLNYDLQLLYDHVKANSNKKVLIFFQDSESFNDGLLADLISVLR